jgi:hypothetical protein
MWRSALAIVCLAVVAGCGGDDDQTASSGCTATVMWNDEAYFGVRHKHLPPPGDVLVGGEKPPCNDGGGAEEQTREVELRSVSGVPPEVAVYLADSPGDVYLNPGYLIELPSHPLHQVFYGPPGRPLRRAQGKSCTFEGEIKSLDAFIVQAPDGEQWITVDARTRVKGFQREGLPYLRAGDRVRIKGKGCNEAVMLAQRIEPAA